MNELDLGEFFGDYIDSRIDILLEEKVDEKVTRRLKEIFEGETVMDLITSTEYRYCKLPPFLRTTFYLFLVVFINKIFINVVMLECVKV
jgi:hypothetical protein